MATRRRRTRNAARRVPRRTRRAKKSQHTRRLKRARTKKRPKQPPKRASSLRSIYDKSKNVAKKISKLGIAAGVAYAGQKLLNSGDNLHTLHSDLLEAQHTAQQVREHLEDVNGPISGYQAAKDIQKEAVEAKQYRDTRKDAMQRDIQMYSRPEYLKKAEESSRDQKEHLKAHCYVAASKLTPKKREEAVRKCEKDYS